MAINTLEQDRLILKDKQERGEVLAFVLGLKQDPETGRYQTEWGDKTTIGLFETVKRIINE